MESSGGDAASLAMAGGMAAFSGLAGLIAYIYVAYSLMIIGKKLGFEQAWMAWVPIVNIYMIFVLAQKPLWWIILLFIPIANIVVMALVWMALCERRGKPGWLGLLFLVPIANLILPGYLAFTD